MFHQFRQQFQANAQQVLKDRRVFKLDVNSEELWEVYLSAFPTEERQANNCNACRRFFRDYGGLVVIDDSYQLTTLWDFVADAYFQPAITAVKEYLQTKKIKEALVVSNRNLGVDKNASTSGWWHHYYLELPHVFSLTKKDKIGEVLNNSQTGKAVYQRALTEITLEAVDTVLELIEENALYRGQEFQAILRSFKQAKISYTSLKEAAKENFCWLQERGALSDIRSSVIGTLLVDLSEGQSVEKAVNAYEYKVAPSNYQRPKAIVTAKTLDAAKATLAELGLQQSIYRRFATPTDLSAADMLYVHRVSGITDVFAEAKKDIEVDASKFKSLPTVGLEEFLVQLQQASCAEILLENEHESNLFSLVTASYPDSPSLFKWDNQFSWTYNNGVADSIRDRVSKAGGNICGLIRVSLAWNTPSDLDLHLQEPRHHIHFASRRSTQTLGQLDVDANANTQVPNPVENIIYPYNAKLLTGDYAIYVHNFNNRQITDQFTVEIEISGVTHTYTHTYVIKQGQRVPIAIFNFDGAKIELKPQQNFSKAAASKEMWGLKTYRFVRILSAFHSPNYWGNNAVGNKHLFFQLEGAVNQGQALPFFNEQIDAVLTQKHKRVFEVLGSKLLLENTEPQVSGLGFSTTNPATFLCKLDGKVIKVTTQAGAK